MFHERSPRRPLKYGGGAGRGRTAWSGMREAILTREKGITESFSVEPSIEELGKSSGPGCFRAAHRLTVEPG